MENCRADGNTGSAKKQIGNVVCERVCVTAYLFFDVRIYLYMHCFFNIMKVVLELMKVAIIYI